MAAQQEKQETAITEKGMNKRQMLLTFLVLFLWLMVFVGGILVNSAPYREVISNHSFTTLSEATAESQMPQSKADIYVAWLVVILFYTPTNVAFLSMIAGLLGALSRIAKLHVKDKHEPELPSDLSNPLISGMLRGIFVYLLVISGVLLINEAPFIAPTQIQYIRLAGFISLLSFLLSYNPSRFRSFLARSLDSIENRIGGKK